jgi:hypothetical protein
MRLLLTTLFLALLPAAQPRATPILRYLTVGTDRIDFDVPGKGAAQFSSVARVLGGKSSADDNSASAPGPTRCYNLSGPAPRMILVFYGDDMTNNVLTDFDLVLSSRKRSLAGKCSSLAVSPKQIVTDRGVRVGLTREEVEEKLGESKRAINGKPIYEVTQARATKLRDGTTYKEEITSSITVTYRNRVVVAFGGGISEAD